MQLNVKGTLGNNVYQRASLVFIINLSLTDQRCTEKHCGPETEQVL